jgi:hypothetical protein
MTLIQTRKSIAPKDLGAMDSCDRLRNEGGWGGDFHAEISAPIA